MNGLLAGVDFFSFFFFFCYLKIFIVIVFVEKTVYGNASDLHSFFHLDISVTSADKVL